jgi:hypothetical protein
VSLEHDAAADYRWRARYPASSLPLRSEVDPVASENQVLSGVSRDPEKQDPTLTVSPRQATFEAPDPIVLDARLTEGGRPVAAEALRAEVRTIGGALLARLTFHDDGTQGDAQAGDLLFTAAFQPAADRAEAFTHGTFVMVEARTLEGELRVATTGFMYSMPNAHLTGRYRDSIEDGHLVIAAEVAVTEAGRLHLEATLAAADGKPIAWAQNALELAEGTGWIPLTFWGLILHERGVDGPYVLRTVALTRPGDAPPGQRAAAVANAYRTRAYHAAQFTDRAFNDPVLLEKAKRLDPLG